MLDSLPIQDSDLTIRPLVRSDLEEYAQWPQYPPNYDAFNQTFSLRLAGMNTEQRDAWFRERMSDESRIALAADLGSERAVASLMLQQIDWNTRKVGNMGFLVKPTRVEQGIGSRIMRLVSDWCFMHGIVSLRLDVVACNTRAVRCYEKVGFSITGEFWKDEEPLRGRDINLPEYDFMRPHLRMENETPQIRFWWMELASPSASERKDHA